jgi:hypothetical protein
MISNLVSTSSHAIAAPGSSGSRFAPPPVPPLRGATTAAAVSRFAPPPSVPMRGASSAAAPFVSRFSSNFPSFLRVSYTLLLLVLAVRFAPPPVVAARSTAAAQVDQVF